ncbi:MAG: hypothetical protein J1F42_06715 [Lachnospiraceae bacterium]|nr:hypothetical protein [Lachnospiraceae bacterium]
MVNNMGGLKVGKITGSSDGYIKVELYNRDGSSAGTMTVSTSQTRASKSKKTSKTSQKKNKKLQYNFKRLSNQILRTKTSANAKQIVTKAKFQIADLRMKLISGDYDYSEIHNALVHAEKIARVAKKRMKNLEEEEYIEKTGRNDKMDIEEMQKNQEAREEEILDTTGMTQEEMKELVQQLQEEMEKIEDELEEAMKETEKLMEEFVQGSKMQMDPADLEQLKKKHRSEEMRDIMKADMEYLKALFNKLAKEKESAGSSSSNTSNDSDHSYGNISGISLEIGGVDIPVETAAQASVEVAGASVNVTV